MVVILYQTNEKKSDDDLSLLDYYQYRDVLARVYLMRQRKLCHRLGTDKKTPLAHTPDNARSERYGLHRTSSEIWNVLFWHRGRS